MDKQIAPFNPPAPIDKSAFSELKVRQEVLDGFMSIRDQHNHLHAVRHQVVRMVELPLAREIGQALRRIQNFYPPGKRGPGGKPSAFYVDCKAVAGLGRSQASDYMRVFDHWGELVDFMADLPEGAKPVLSLDAAVNAIAAIRRAERQALPGSDGAVDVDAQEVQGSALPAKARTNYARSTREKTVPLLEALLSTAVGRRNKERIVKVIEAVELLLQSLEQQEVAGGDEWSEDGQPAAASARANGSAPVPAAISSLEEKGERLANFFNGEVVGLEVAAPTPAPAPVEEPAAAEGPVSLTSLFPASTPGESYEAMNELVVRHGNGKDAAASLPCALSSFKNHKSRLKRLMQAQEQGEA